MNAAGLKSRSPYKQDKNQFLIKIFDLILSLTLLQTGQRSTTLTVTVPCGPVTEMDLPQRLLLLGLPFGVCGSKSGAAIAQIRSLSVLVTPQAPRPAKKYFTKT